MGVVRPRPVPHLRSSPSCYPKNRLCLAAVHASGEHAAAVDVAGGLYIFDLCTGDIVQALREAPPGGALCFARHSRDEILYSVCNKVRVVDVLSRKTVTTLLGHQRSVHFATAAGCCALSQSDDAIILWKVADWSRIRSLVEPSSTIFAAELSPHGESVALLYAGSRIALWDTTSGAPQMDLKVPEAKAQACESLQRLAIGQDFVVASNTSDGVASGSNGSWIMVLWRLAKRSATLNSIRPVTVEGQIHKLDEPISQLLARGSMIFVAHSKGLRAMAMSMEPKLAVDVKGLLHVALDARGTCGLLVRKSGELEKFSVTNLRRVLLCSGPGRPARTQHPRSSSETKGGALPESSSVQSFLEKSAERSSVRRKLLSFLKRHGAFPEAYRPALLQLLLQLPQNSQAYASVVDASPGTLFHARYLAERAEVPDSEECRRLCKAIAALTTWAPILADFPDFSRMAAPFVRVFDKDEVLAFEICAFVAINWVRPWLEVVPHAPLDILTPTRELLRIADAKLLGHLEACANEEQEMYDMREHVLWPLFRTGLSECLPKETWLALWDHILAYWQESHLLGAAVVAVLCCLRSALLSVSSKQPAMFSSIVRQRQVLPAAQVLEQFFIIRTLPVSDKARSTAEQRHHFISGSSLPLLSTAPYPPLLNDSHFVIDYFVSDRKRARARAAACRRSIEETLQVYANIEGLVNEEADARAAEAKLLRQERSRYALSAREDEFLLSQHQQQLHAAAAERLSRIDGVCSVADKWMEQQQDLHDAEHFRLANEMARQRSHLTQEVEETQLESTLINLEGTANRQVLDIRSQRQVGAAARAMRQAVRMRLLERENEDELQWRRQRVDNEREHADVQRSVAQQLQDHQLGMVGMQHHEVQMELEIADQMSKAQIDRVSQVRAARAAARKAQAEADARSQARRSQLEADGKQFFEACTRKLLRAQQLREHSQQVQQERLEELQQRMQESTKQKGQLLQEALLAEERARFKECINQRLLEDCDVAGAEEAKFCDMLENLEHMEFEGEREMEQLLHRREAAQHQEQELELELERSMNQPLPRDERRHVCRVLRRHLASINGRAQSRCPDAHSVGDASNSGMSMLDDDVLSTSQTASSDPEDGSPLPMRNASADAAQSDQSSPLVLDSWQVSKALSSSSEKPRKRDTNRRW